MPAPRRIKPPALLAAAALAAAAGSHAPAGPITPPPGPVAPTFKTLAEVEPRTAISATATPGDADSLFRITQPGSYYLTANLTGQPGLAGIEIAASGVTIDLMGHTLQGAPGSLDGIAAPGFRNNITIRGGTITGWGDDGIDLAQMFVGAGCLIESIHTSANAARGINASHNAVIRACTAYNNGAHGFEAPGAAVIESCTARDNGAAGFSAAAAATIARCTAAGNTGHGFAAGQDCSILDCTARGNGASGIAAGPHTTVRACLGAANALHGITAGDICLVESNTCTGNGAAGDGAGIHTSGQAARIDGNACTGNDWGFRILGSGNLVVRNTAGGNSTSNWYIAILNAPAIIVQAGVLAATFEGNSRAGTLGENQPFANITY